MPNCADTAKFRVGRSTDVLYVQFYAHVICNVETKDSGTRRKRDSTAPEMLVGLETEKDLENERMRRSSVSSMI